MNELALELAKMIHKNRYVTPSWEESIDKDKALRFANRIIKRLHSHGFRQVEAAHITSKDLPYDFERAYQVLLSANPNGLFTEVK